MTLRCLLDDLLLPAKFAGKVLLAFDGDESFSLDALEAVHYELLAASPAELLTLERSRYRLLRRAVDFHEIH